MNKGFYAGSFDPLTNGHLDIIQRASQLCDELVVALMDNPSKQRLFSTHEMQTLIQRLVPNNVTVTIFPHQLTTTAARSVNATCLIRGMRDERDFTNELALADNNRRLSGLDTVFLLTDPKWRSTSSSLVKELVVFDGDYTLFVPSIIAQAIDRKKGEL